MNEFTAKKLGEVLAFCRVGAETISRGQKAMEEALGNDGVSYVLSGLESQAKTIESIAQEGDSSEITLKKAEATGKKLSAMRDLYVGDEWDNPTELMEWHGFFEGAAIVHWELVMGSGIGLANTELQNLAKEAVNFHKSLLDQVSEILRTTGSTRASK